MRYFKYKTYIKVFRYIRDKDFDRNFLLDEKFGKRGNEAKSILESRKGIVNVFTGWNKNVAIIDSIIIEYEDRVSQLLWNFVIIIISICTFIITLVTLLKT